MAERFVEKRNATRTMAIRPTTPVYFAIALRSLADDFENQFALLDGMLREFEGVFYQIGRFRQMLFAGVIDAAQDTAGLDLLSDFDFENHPDGRIDRIFLRIAPGADHR